MGIKMSRAVEKYYGGEIYDDREIYDDDGETNGEKIATRVILDYFIKKELVPQLEVANWSFVSDQINAENPEFVGKVVETLSRFGLNFPEFVRATRIYSTNVIDITWYGIQDQLIVAARCYKLLRRIAYGNDELVFRVYLACVSRVSSHQSGTWENLIESYFQGDLDPPETEKTNSFIAERHRLTENQNDDEEEYEPYENMAAYARALQILLGLCDIRVDFMGCWDRITLSNSDIEINCKPKIIEIIDKRKGTIEPHAFDCQIDLLCLLVWILRLFGKETLVPEAGSTKDPSYYDISALIRQYEGDENDHRKPTEDVALDLTQKSPRQFPIQ